VGADPTWPNRARYSIPWDVTLGSGGGGAARRKGTCGLGGGAAPVLSGRVAVWVVQFVVVFSPYLYCCCSCFPLFAILLNCPYPDPPVSASFFSFSSAPRRGEGRPCGAFVAGGSRNQDTHLTVKNFGA